MSSSDISIGPPKDFVMTRRKTMYHHIATCVISRAGENQRRHRFSHISQSELIKGVRECMEDNGWRLGNAIEWTNLDDLKGKWVDSRSTIEMSYLLPNILSPNDFKAIESFFKMEFE